MLLTKPKLSPVLCALLCIVLVTATQASAEPEAARQPETAQQPGWLGAGLHVQAGLALGQTLAGEPILIQPHPRLALRYDRSASRVWRVTGRHQRLNGDDAGHAELTLTPTVLQRWRLTNKLYAMAGGGVSLGAFTRFAPEGSERLKTDYAIPLTGEASATLIWQLRSALSIELTVDYRPVFFSDGDIEHILTQSLSLSVDL